MPNLIRSSSRVYRPSWVQTNGVFQLPSSREGKKIEIAQAFNDLIKKDGEVIKKAGNKWKLGTWKHRLEQHEQYGILCERFGGAEEVIEVLKLLGTPV